jgi:small-conductance mechanosensitive channel
MQSRNDVKPKRCKAETVQAATRKAATRKAAKPTNKLVTAQVHWNSKLTQVLRFQKQRVSKTTCCFKNNVDSTAITGVFF